MVEHSTADREVPGSNPGAPSKTFCFFVPTDNPARPLTGDSSNLNEFNIQALKARFMKI